MRTWLRDESAFTVKGFARCMGEAPFVRRRNPVREIGERHFTPLIHSTQTQHSHMYARCGARGCVCRFEVWMSCYSAATRTVTPPSPAGDSAGCGRPGTAYAAGLSAAVCGFRILMSEMM